jgi:hypothetical protein
MELQGIIVEPSRNPEQLNELLVKMQALSFFMQMQPLDTGRI